MSSLWVEKYRPTRIEDYIGNQDIVDKVKEYLENKEIPNILLSGVAGTGKTTLSKIIAFSISEDVLFINASDENSVDVIRIKIKQFASSVGFSKYKIIVLDEADYITINGQAALRRVLEDFHEGTRFILTCNYHERLLDPIKSRLQMFNIQPLDKISIAKRMEEILKKEEVTYKIESVIEVIKAYYPDIRKIIQVLEQNVDRNNNLRLSKETIISSDYKNKILDALSDRTTGFKNIRQLIADNSINDFAELYTYLFNHAHQIVKENEDLMEFYILLGEYMYRDTISVDKEINFMAFVASVLKA